MRDESARQGGRLTKGMEIFSGPELVQIKAAYFPIALARDAFAVYS
jgi:hypothetical protein